MNCAWIRKAVSRGGLKELDEVLANRRAQLRLRLGSGAAVALFVSPLAGWVLSFGWLALYAALQLLELRLPRRGVSPLAALAILNLNAWVFGGFAALAPLNDGVWGLAAGFCLLVGSLLNAALTSQQSKAAFIASMSPTAVYLAMMPFLALGQGAEHHHALLFAFTSLSIVLSTSMVWNAAARALNAEGEARARAESADAAKSAFVAMVSHELRTPISAILAGAGEAAKPQSDAARRSNLELIAESGRMMTTLLNDLLDLSKLEAGKMSVERIRFDLRQLVLDTVRFWEPEARKRGLGFGLNGARALPRWMVGDPTRIRQILNNLLSNAFKFTDEGAITLRFEVGGETGGPRRIEMAVADTGVGMTEDQARVLFTAFGQVDASVARTHGGTGLGLNISRELARLMGGELDAVSAPGEGSTFTLRLDLGAAAETAGEPAAPEPVMPPSRLRILLADDHAINRRAFTLLLEPIAQEIVTAVDGMEAAELAGRSAFDLVLLDLNMPRLNGLETARRLRTVPGPNRETPIIALTGSTSEKDVRACEAAGMDGFVAKPVEAAQLYATLSDVLERASIAGLGAKRLGIA